MATTKETEAAKSSDDAVVWTPSEAYLSRSRLRRFMEHTGSTSYDDHLRRASADPAWYWDAVVRDLELDWVAPYDRVLDLSHGTTTWRMPSTAISRPAAATIGQSPGKGTTAPCGR